MCGATHLLAGATIYSLFGKKPSPKKKFVAIILAFSSHFLLDAFPHFALDSIPQSTLDLPHFALSGFWQSIAAFIVAIFIVLIAWKDRDIFIIFCSFASRYNIFFEHLPCLCQVS